VLLSIIIPVYNVEKYIDKCLQSVSDQDIPKNEYEILVIDDGSTDNSPEIIRAYSKKYDNIKIATKENGGVSSARNTGLNMAQGKYILFVDSDDMIKENSLSKVLYFAENCNPDLLQFECNIIRNDAKYSEPACCSAPTLFSDKEAYLKTCIFTKKIWHIEMWRFLFKKSLLDNNRIRFNQEICMGEDQLFTIEAISRAGKIAYSPEIIYRYLVRSGSTMNSFSYKHAVSQLKSAFEIKKILEANKNIGKFEVLFYQRFINIFVIYQYIDRIFSDASIKDPVKIIKKDIQTYSFKKLYFIPQYKSGLLNILVYNTGVALYCRYVQFKRNLAKQLKK